MGQHISEMGLYFCAGTVGLSHGYRIQYGKLVTLPNPRVKLYSYI